MTTNARMDILKKMIKKFYLREVSEGYYEYTIYPSYDESVSEKTILKVAENSSSLEEYILELENYIWDAYYEYNDYSEFAWYIKNTYPIEELISAGFTSDDELLEWLKDTIYYNFCEDEIIRQSTVEVVMSIIKDETYYVVQNELEGKKDALSWLCEEQGYTFPTKEKERENNFLNSVYEEVHDYCTAEYNYGHLCVAARVSALDYGRIIFKEFKKITVPKDATVGIMDLECGGGSGMGIELEKPLTIPVEYVHIFDTKYTYQNIYEHKPTEIELVYEK